MVERVPEELWMEVYNIVQEAVTKTSPKKKFKMAEWLSEKVQKHLKKEDKGKKKGLNDPDYHNGMVSHLELDILKCKVGLRKY